jgi:hypothetical protein
LAEPCPDEPVLATIEAFELEFLPGFNAILLSELGRQDDLTLGGHRRDRVLLQSIKAGQIGNAG